MVGPMIRTSMRLAASVALAAAVAGCAGKQEITRGSGPLHEACSDGNLDACYQQAVLLEAGSDAERREALTAFQYGCLLQHAPSCGGLSRMYGDDETAVTAEIEAACASGDAQACVRVGDRAPRAQAAQFYDRACAAQNGDGCHRLAQELRRGWVIEDNVTSALELDTRACEYGSVDACFAVGQAHLFGSGTAKNPDQAFEYFAKTCNDQERSGCKVLGVMFDNGIGVAQDGERASEYFALAGPELEVVADSPAAAYLVFVDACNRGNYLGCFDAAWFLEEGVSVERNITSSRELFEKACEGGVTPACARIATQAGATEQG